MYTFIVHILMLSRLKHETLHGIWNKILEEWTNLTTTEGCEGNRQKVGFWLFIKREDIQIINGMGAIAPCNSPNLFTNFFFFFYFYLFIFTFFYIKWLRFKVFFCNFKSQPPILIVSGAISRILHLINPTNKHTYLSNQ